MLSVDEAASLVTAPTRGAPRDEALARAVATLHGGALLLGDANPGLRAILDLPEA